MAVGYSRLYYAIPRICTSEHPRTPTSLLDLRRIAPVIGSRDYPIFGKSSVLFPSCRQRFSLKSPFKQAQREPGEPEQPQGQKKKSTRSPVGKTSLRRVAVEAQRSRGGIDSRKLSTPESPATTKVGPDGFSRNGRG